MGKIKQLGRILTVIAATALLTSCASSPAEVQEITSIEYSQSQALPNFDNSTHTTTDSDDIAALAAVLDEYGVTGDYTNGTDSACDGALSTSLKYTSVADSVTTITINGNCKETAFDDAVSKLVSSWRTGN